MNRGGPEPNPQDFCPRGGGREERGSPRGGEVAVRENDPATRLAGGRPRADHVKAEARLGDGAEGPGRPHLAYSSRGSSR